VARSVSSSAARVALLGAAVLTLSLAAPTAAPAARSGNTTEPTTSVFSIVTYNAEAKVRPARTMDDLATILETDPDIVALQEMSSGEKRKLVRETYLDCAECVWDGYMPGPAVPGGTPLLYRSDRFLLLDSGTVQVTEPTYVGKRGAGPATIRAKYVNWVRLRDLRSGRVVHVLNNHTVPSVQGHGGGPNYRSPKRLEIYRKHMAGVQSLVQDIHERYPWGLVFVTGDLNVNYRRDRVVAPSIFPYRMLGEVGLHASYEALGEPRIGTHMLPSGNGTRLIDYVYYLPRRPLVPSSQRILTGLNSDHRPLLVAFEVTNLRTAGGS
jgi:endonuclease/exonuclease/phosphatase (EEP) superfamily protein YafD